MNVISKNIFILTTIAVLLSVQSCCQHEEKQNVANIITQTGNNCIENTDSCVLQTIGQPFRDVVAFRLPDKRVRARKGHALLIETEGLCLAATDTAVMQSEIYSVTSLYEDELPPLPQGMMNMTAATAGYRLLPGGEHFLPYAELRMTYDPERLPEGYTPDDIYTSFYDTAASAWVRLERVEVDTVNHEIVSLTTHFTDFINELLKAPEMPETQAFVPTAMNDLEAVSPMDGLTMIQPPTANNNGTANVSYPLVIPAGRGGMQPNLALTYSSTGGSGWLGVGWDIPVPSISLDTRWGVPRYDTTYETEIYLLNGEQLVARDADGTVLDMPHRTNSQTLRENLRDSVQFIARTGDAHDSIIRYGNSPKNYWWKVIDRNGITHYYGRYEDPDRSIEIPVVNSFLPRIFPLDISFDSIQNKLQWKLPTTLCDDNGNIARWVLTESRDLYGNTVRYYYDRATVKNRGSEGRQLYLDSISYTGRNETDGYYTVVFCRTGNSTPDVPVSCNNGFKEITDQLLNNVYLKCGNSIEILWHFEMRNDNLSNYKNRLVSVTKIDTLSGMTMRGLLNNLCHCIQYDDDEYGTFPKIYRVNGVTEKYDTVYIPAFDTIKVPLFDTIMTLIPDPKNNGYDTIYEFKATGDTILRIRVNSYSMRIDTIYNPGYESINHFEPQSLAEINPVYAGSTTRFDYYDAPNSRDLFSDTVTCKFTSQHLRGFLLTDIQNLTPLGRATALGINNSFSWNIGGAAAAGTGTNVCLTTASLGGNYTRSGSASESIMTLIDLDGDGLADKVYIKDGAMYFCRQYLKDDNHFDFRSPKMIPGAHHFLKESSTSCTFGVQASLGTSASANWTNSKSTTSTYFADVNGDGLVDLVNDGQVLFNHLRASDTVPVFSPINTTYVTPQGEQEGTTATEVETLDTVCQEIIFDGAASDSIDCRRVWVLIDTFWVQPNMRDYYTWLNEHTIDSMIVMTEYSRTEGIWIEIFRREWDCSYHDDLPNTEAVRVWVAPRRGYVDVFSEIGLIQDTSASRRAARNVDGVVLTVQRTTDVHIDNERFAHGTNEPLYTAALCDTCYMNSSNNNTLEKRNKIIFVKEGDIIFFRLRSKLDHNFDDVYARHIVKYRDNGETFDSEKDFVVSSDYCFQAPVNGTFTVTGEWSDGEGSAILYIKGTSAIVSGNKIDHSDRASKDENICIEVYPRGGNNADWGKVVCRPYITFIPEPGTSLSAPAPAPTPTPENNATVSVNEPIKGWLVPHMNIIHTYPQYNHSLYRRLFGPLYKGWGQFAYHTEGDDSNMIRVETLVPSDMMVSGNSSSHDQNEMNRIVNANNVHARDFESSESLEDFEQNSNFYNPYSVQSSWVEMNPDAEHWVWVGYGHQNTIGRKQTSNSLQKNWYSETPKVNNVEDHVTHTQTVVDLPEATSYDDPVPPAYNGAPAKAVRKVNRSKSHSWSTGFAQWGTSFSGGSNTIETDYMDLNGDRYPDIIGTDMVQYSQQWGGVGPLKPLCSAPGQGSHTKSEGASFSASAITQERTLCGIQSNAFFSLHSEGSRSVNGGGNVGHDYADASWMDMNGDGLVDLIYPDGHVKLNIGYGFLDAEQWSLDKVRNGVSGSISVGVGVQGSQHMTEWIPDRVMNVWQGSIEAGAGISGSYNQTTFMMMDINGDGLPDKLWRELSEINDIVDGADFIKTVVSYNLGSGQFSSPETLDIGRFHSSASFNESLNVGLTYGFTLWGFKVTLGLNACPYSGGVTQDYVQLADVNADGLPDWVYSIKEDEMVVRYNMCGKTNLLRSVTNFNNAIFQIDYSLSEPDLNQPSRSWLMTKVTTYDSLNGHNGATSAVTEYTYANPHYDRYERTSYGYGKVTTSHIDPTTGLAYRKTDHDYYNNNMLRRGKLKRELTYVDSNELYIEKTHECSYIDYLLGDTLNADALCPSIAYPAVEATLTKFYEGGITPLLTVGERTEYDRYHNVIKYSDLGDISVADDGLVVVFSYFTGLDNNLIGLRKDYTVTPVGTTTAMRHARFEYDFSHGKVTRQVLYNDSDSSVYDFKYDAVYGNLDTAMQPLNDSNQRMTYHYQYDDIVHTYPTRIINSYDDSMSTTYDYRYGKPLTVTDPTGSTMSYRYDFAGRLRSVNSPLNTADTPSLVNEYHPTNYYHNGLNPHGYTFSASPTHHPYSVSKHYGDDGTLITETAVLTNGFGMAIQTKKGLSTNGLDMLQVSGRTVVDAFGRAVEQYDPVAEIISTHRGRYNTDFDVSSLTHTTYDVLDRTTSVVMPLGISSHTSYSIDNDSTGQPRFVTTTTDPNGNITKQFSDYDGHCVQVVSDVNGISATTLMHYDNLGQLDWTKDPEGFTTFYGYDNLGRLKYRDHPDAGKISYNYDPAGNVILETTPIGQIFYSYTYYRPIFKRYSYMNGNNVTYTYGTSGTGTGRLIRIADGSGMYECDYDGLGNVVDETRTITMPKCDEVYRFRMLYKYDSWGRMLSITYPDSEKVTYTYQWGGDLYAMHGDKRGNTRTYIDSISYNLYGQKEHITYGNASNTIYTYDSLHRLINIRSYDGGGLLMQDIDYSLDSVGNVTSINNGAGVLNSMGGAYVNRYQYDNLNRLIFSDGRGDADLYDLNMVYSPSGRIVWKHRRTQSASTSETVDMAYAYCDEYQPHAVKRMFDYNGLRHFDLRWDDAGNLEQVCIADRDALFETGRFLFWTVDNRMHASVDDNFYSYYSYDHGGERRLKLTGKNNRLDINADYLATFTMLNNITLYPSAYMVVTDRGYTKHYYAGTDRVAARIGSGGLNTLCQVAGDVAQSNGIADTLFLQSIQQVHDRVLRPNDVRCLDAPSMMQRSIVGMPSAMHADVSIDNHRFKNMIRDMAKSRLEEPDVFFYHSDHLGSASWITNAAGAPVQHLQYLPFGEPFVNQHAPGSGYSERFRFTGKERDEETGYGYFGARYMDYELMTMWLSVDPMSDKYPSISPYAYCAWNPIRLIDPDGREVGDFLNEKGEKIGSDGKDDGNKYLLKMVRPSKRKTDSEADNTLFGISRDERRKTEDFIRDNDGKQDAFIEDCIAYNNSVLISTSADEFAEMRTKCKDESLKVFDVEYGGIKCVDGMIYGGNDGTVPGLAVGGETSVTIKRSDKLSFRYWFHHHPDDRSIFQMPSSADLETFPDLTGYTISFRQKRIYVTKEGKCQGYITFGGTMKF